MAQKTRGVFERPVGSGIWWIRYADADGKIRREKVGRKVPRLSCIKREKHKFERESKLPHKLRARLIKFSEIAEDALRYCKAKNQGHQFDTYRHGRLNEEFGNRNAEIPIEDLRGWFDQQDWEPGTYNRYKSTLSLTYRLGHIVSQ